MRARKGYFRPYAGVGFTIRPGGTVGTIVGIAGPSGVGKTRVAEELVGALAPRGVRTGYLKHAPHGFELDRPGSDSARLTAAGASAVAVVGNGRVYLTRAAPDDPGPMLEHLDTVGCDVVLVEGYHASPWPKIVVTSKATLDRDVTGDVIARVRVERGAPHAGDLADAVDAVVALMRGAPYA
jgi:molybdopterin-guanine dinucleotide biosynthesis protein MobB